MHRLLSGHAPGSRLSAPSSTAQARSTPTRCARSASASRVAAAFVEAKALRDLRPHLRIGSAVTTARSSLVKRGTLADARFGFLNRGRPDDCFATKARAEGKPFVVDGGIRERWILVEAVTQRKRAEG